MHTNGSRCGGMLMQNPKTDINYERSVAWKAGPRNCQLIYIVIYVKYSPGPNLHDKKTHFALFYTVIKNLIALVAPFQLLLTSTV